MNIIDSDAFLDMPLSAQALYFHLIFRADKGGVINNTKSILRAVGASESDLETLTEKHFVFTRESGEIVITNWRIAALLRK